MGKSEGPLVVEPRSHVAAVFVRWNDTTSEDEWKDYDGPVNTTVESVFWLIDCNEKCLVVSANHCRDSDSKEWGHIWHIPHGAIDTWYEIEPGKPW